MVERTTLTPVELELMEILWAIKEGTVHDVQAQLPSNRKLVYTTVSTMLRILQQKEVVTIRKEGRKHIYRPLMSKQKFTNHSVKKIIKHSFSGNSVELVNYLLGKNTLSITEINAIQELLDSKKKELTEC